ncbi:hypothetical protein LguiA_015311 [Lonicera macranthoides]
MGCHNQNIHKLFKFESFEEKVSNAASAAKEHVDIYKAKVDEKAAKATARTKEEEAIIHERRKAKEAEAKMHLHDEKAQHAAEKLGTKQSHHLYGHHGAVGGDGHQHHIPGVGTAAPTTGATYPPGGHLPGYNNKSV